tara:strand:- start:21 stop:476 length:456 start_codon:yes stop_codon:yes gene_type:complete
MNKELKERLKKANVSYFKMPGYVPIERPFTLGNMIFSNKRTLDEYGGDAEILEEEIPHVAQYRELGILNFLGKYLGEMIEHKGQKDMYTTLGTLESFHQMDKDEKKKLLSKVLGPERVLGPAAITKTERSLTKGIGPYEDHMKNVDYWLTD